MQQTRISESKKAPDFTLASPSRFVHLTGYRGRQAVLVCFVPDFAQAQTWRLLLALASLTDELQAQQVPVLVIGNGRRLLPATHLLHSLRLPFTLLADDNGEVSALYDVASDTCACFLIDHAGRIQHMQQLAVGDILNVDSWQAAICQLPSTRYAHRTQMSALPYPAFVMS